MPETSITNFGLVGQAFVTVPSSHGRIIVELDTITEVTTGTS